MAHPAIVSIKSKAPAQQPRKLVRFFPEPCPGQTLADVLHALRRFVEEVGRRHEGTA